MNRPVYTGKSVGYLQLMRQNPNFRWLWGGQVVSLLGDWFNLIASAILIAELTGSGLAVGVLFTIRMLAPFAVAPIAGICADRYNRKTSVNHYRPRACCCRSWVSLRPRRKRYLVTLHPHGAFCSA